MPDRLPAGILCDMDGLLLDSERLARDAFVRACADHGWAADLDVYHRCIGSTYEQTREILTAAFGPEFPYEAIDARWSSHYHARLARGPVPVKDGAVELLEHLARRRVPVVLVTSTHRPTAEVKLRAARLLGFFEGLICGGETARGKPHPDPYLSAAGRLGVEAGRCWALEDSANGVRAAHGAGCMVFQVPDLVPPDDDLRKLGHRIVTTLHDVREALEAL
ncbi:MAG: HAD family phosphatase [Pseudomonadales bacterium]|jgi:HAD superfamily hydrolase (TIGR01509 family)